MRLGKIIVASILGFSMAGPALAQLSGQGGPIQVKAQRSEVLDRQKQVIITGDVDIVQADTALRADKVVLSYTGNDTTRTSGIGGSFGDIKTMRATGNVFYLTPELKATGDTGVYNAVTETIRLDGEEVILQRGEDFATGRCLVMNLKAGRTDLYGTPCNKDGEGTNTRKDGDRVIFVIDQNTAQGSGR